MTGNMIQHCGVASRRPSLAQSFSKAARGLLRVEKAIMTESKETKFDAKQVIETVETAWKGSIEKALCDYIKIENQSPQFDKAYYTNGLTEKAMDVMVKWVEAQKVPGLKLEIITEKNRTPLIFIEVEGEGKTEDTILLYGHLDKQPPFVGWHEGLGPYKPVIKDGKLYGRGGADDGYAIFAAVTAINALKKQNVPHARLILMIEACEESGSRDLMHYVGLKAKEIGTPSLVICLDSGCSNYEQMWLTTSLRGMLLGELRVKILNEGVHSGSGSGIVPSSFRILRNLLERIEDSKTGEVLLKEAYAEIPEKFVKYAQETAQTLGQSIVGAFPWVEGAKPMSSDLAQCILNSTWRPVISYTGVDGIPAMETAGNVLRPETALKLSIRLPPTVKPAPLEAALKEVLEKDVPYGAKVTFTAEKSNPGWTAPIIDPWLEKALSSASTEFFGKGVRLCGEGGSIPFMGMLGAKFPQTQFVITGLLGPGSNAHGPNEFLHIQTFKNLTCCVTSIIKDHFSRPATKSS